MRPKEERISPRLASSDLNPKETNNCKAQAELGSTDADADTAGVRVGVGWVAGRDSSSKVGYQEMKV